jgi:hypothetical protein
MLRFDGSNFTGIFWFQRGTNKKLLYCITNKGEKVGNPITSPLWEKKVREAEQGVARENRRTATELLDPDNNATTTDEPLAEPTDQSDGVNQKGAANQSGESSSDIPDAKRVKRQTAAEEIASRSYWLSDEAICLFAPKGNETADEALEQRIEILGWATGSNEGWREIVKGHDPDNLCSDNDIFELRQRCMLLCVPSVPPSLKNLGRTEWRKAAASEDEWRGLHGIRITSRFLGFEPELTTAQLRAVNERRALESTTSTRKLHLL